MQMHRRTGLLQIADHLRQQLGAASGEKNAILYLDPLDTLRQGWMFQVVGCPRNRIANTGHQAARELARRLMGTQRFWDEIRRQSGGDQTIVAGSSKSRRDPEKCATTFVVDDKNRIRGKAINIIGNFCHDARDTIKFEPTERQQI